MPKGQEGPVALVPVEQAYVTIFGRQVRAIRLPDGRIAAVLTDLCHALNLDRPPQVRRIREDDMLAEQLLFAQVDTPEGLQPMDVLAAWAIPTWLQGVQVSRLATEKRPAILAFKREAADVLYRHFAQRQPTVVAPSTLVPVESITRPAAPAAGAPPAEWITFHKQMVTWLEWQEDMEAWRGSVESRLEGHDEALRLLPEILERLGPATLTAEHQHTVQASVKRLHEVSGLSYGAVYSDLGTSFHVGRYQDIRDTEWPAVAEWFAIRIRASGKRQ
jgi:hypothetical protein